MIYTLNNSNIPTYVGRAKCSPEDDFSIELGQELSYLRAKEKYLNDIRKFHHKTWLFHKNRMHEEVEFLKKNDTDLRSLRDKLYGDGKRGFRRLVVNDLL